jgi:long-chain fatty acid transport protein
MTHEIPRFSSLRTRLLGMTALAGLCAAVTLPAADANAAGFALKEQSAAAQGNSFAGATAGAEDVTYMFFNPAGLTRQEGHQVAVVLSYIAPSAETSDATSVIGGSGVQDGGESALVPAAYFMWSLSPDLKLGMGINAPFGLKTEYDPTWAGRMYAIESELKTININPTVAYKLNDMISIGAGLQIQYSDVTLTNDLNGLGLIGELTGDDWGVGATLGLLVEFSESTRAGLGYRSQISHTLEGEFTAGGSLVDTVTADLTTPDQVTAGLYHDINDQFAVMAEIGWTNWSTFDEIRVKFDSGGPDNVTPEDWDNVWFGAVGVTWKASENLAIRGGIAYDQSPIPDATRTPRIPGEDRTWLSLGVNYAPTPNFSIDAGYTHIFVDDSTVNVTYAPTPNLTATFENAVDILTVQGTFRF